jgi:membrane-bound serine protease (ClpP class)
MKRLCACSLALALLALLALLAPAMPSARAAEAADVVYIIPIHDTIESALLYVIRRGVAEAEAAGAKAIIFVMDTPGGTLDAASAIVRTLQAVQVPTYALVEKDAFSAGAIIALATDHIYMTPGSVIGDAMPIMMSPMGGGPQEMPEDLQEKMVSAVAALIRSAAQESGHDPKLAEKMVRREIEYRIGDEVISPTNQLLTLTNAEAERKVGADQRPLLSEGTVKDINELIDRIGLSQAQRRELQVTWAERVARFLKSPVVSMILLAAGLLGIYIEVKTPGFGLPGGLGAVCLGLFFWGHHIAGLAGTEEILLFMVGFILVVLEVFVFPGLGVLGIGGACLMLWAILAAMVQRLPGGPILPALPELHMPLVQVSGAVIIATLCALALGKVLPKTSVYGWLVLNRSTSRVSGFAAADTDDSLIGQVAIAITPLRPAGAAQLGDRRVDVVTRGEFIDTGRKVRIIDTHGSRVVVEAAQAAEEKTT